MTLGRDTTFRESARATSHSFRLHSGISAPSINKGSGRKENGKPAEGWQAAAEQGQSRDQGLGPGTSGSLLQQPLVPFSEARFQRPLSGQGDFGAPETFLVAARAGFALVTGGRSEALKAMEMKGTRDHLAKSFPRLSDSSRNEENASSIFLQSVDPLLGRRESAHSEETNAQERKKHQKEEVPARKPQSCRDRLHSSRSSKLLQRRK